MPLQALLKPPRLRAADELKERHATWLELFYDLIIMVAVSQTASLLVDAYSLRRMLLVVGLFVPVWWVWAGHTVYATRYDSDDLVYRCLTFVQMFAVMGMAVEVEHAFHGNGFRYAAAYLATRAVLLVLLTRAFFHVREGVRMNRVYLTGFGIGAAIWSLSLVAAERWRIPLWTASLCFELLVPWYVWVTRHPGSAVSASHIPERFGLFTIIVLGESLVAEVRGLSGSQWQLTKVGTAAAGFIVAAGIWWVYFARLERVIGRVKLGSGQPFMYAHFPLQAGIVLLSAGTVQALRMQTPADDGGQSLLVAGFALWALGGFLIHHATNVHEARAATPRYGALAAAVALLAAMMHSVSPTTLLWVLAGVMLLFVIFDERARLAVAGLGGK